ncbi:phosphoglucose isomerase-like protein [Kribbella sp. VKM Ac-2527]|uniref:Phosphoglucose isomerase-like protein n=1 Tax=Kribbella caucasensis TaxID=2512215 RepID=A0A4R6KKR9_9ACTN|nr:SIS domain-containing protein [Kribbella sp. VKM Ac-2527]TDO51336.1 phosphoglucose isomerase-like protein [Kribbella sp. VKM Ac-2527]
MSSFDDSRLDDPAALQATDHLLRRLAGAGARIRAEIDAAEEALSQLDSDGFRPRAIVAAGRDARLVRAVLEPVCPVPFVAWPGPGLPGWTGPLDLVIVLGGSSADTEAMSATSEAVRRGCGLMLASPEDSPVAQASAGSRHAIRLPSQSDDQLAAAVAVLQGLHQMELGPVVDAKSVAALLDEVAIECSPNNDVAANPAKDLSLMLADALPLVWGGSVLAARAARRVVEAIRLASGRPALAADAGHLLPVLNQPPRDLFADPFDQADELRPGLIILDDGVEDAGVAEHRRQLEEKAERHDVRVHVVTQANGTDIARYAALTQHGRYAAAYLGIGLGRYGTPVDDVPVVPGNPAEDPAW